MGFFFWLLGYVGYFCYGLDVFGGIVMVVEVLGYCQCVYFYYCGYLIDVVVIGYVFDVFVYVDGVVEVDEFWNFVDVVLYYGFVFDEVCLDGFEEWVFVLYL